MSISPPINGSRPGSGLRVERPPTVSLARFLPPEVQELRNPQTDLPRIAKDEGLMRLIEAAVQQLPTQHRLNLGDAREMDGLRPDSVHLVVTSPPYWTLKDYRDSTGQMGHIEDYDEFLRELDRVWAHCFRALVPGGRLVCVVGDVCLSRRENDGRHTVGAAARIHPGALPVDGVR